MVWDLFNIVNWVQVQIEFSERQVSSIIELWSVSNHRIPAPYPQRIASYNKMPLAHGSPVATSFSAGYVSSQSLGHFYHLDLADVVNSPPVHRSRSSNTDFAASGAPAVRVVWWVCCNCNHMCNPALAPDRCSLCGHYKCAACSAVNVWTTALDSMVERPRRWLTTTTRIYF